MNEEWITTTKENRLVIPKDLVKKHCAGRKNDKQVKKQNQSFSENGKKNIRKNAVIS